MTDARPLRAIALRALLFTVVVPGTVGVYLPDAILRRSAAVAATSPAARAGGVLLLAAGLAIYARCVADFALAGRGTPAPVDPPRALVARGLYRRSRNPMYVGVLAVIAGQAVRFGSLPLAVYAIVVFAAFHTFVVAWEEPTLRRSFGAEYERYCAAVPRWLPRLRARGA